MKLYMFRTVRLSITRSLFTVHSAVVYVIQVCRELSSRSICSCSKATGWTVRGSNPGGGEIFRIRPDRPWGLPSLLCNGYQVRFAGCCSILQTGHITLSSTPDQELENHNTKYHRQQPLYNTLELLMMGMVVPETCWASKKLPPNIQVTLELTIQQVIQL